MARADHYHVELFGEDLHEKINEKSCDDLAMYSNNLARFVILITCRHSSWIVYWSVISVTLQASGGIMTTSEFCQQLDARIAKYDLLCHPFYKAWAAGELTRADLRAYAQEYYHHVEAFPSYLAAFGLRLEEGDLRRAVLENMCDEKGVESGAGKDSAPHSELWLDFAEGMGSSRNLNWHNPVPEVRELTRHFYRVAGEGLPEEALAAFYAYESQVPRVAQEKARGLRELYGADDKTCGYFALHATADVHHARVWRTQLEKRVAQNPKAAEAALDAAEDAARALWQALDGIETLRMATTV
jgi:pyrroloquinoline-quinone synthase